MANRLELLPRQAKVAELTTRQIGSARVATTTLELWLNFHAFSTLQASKYSQPRYKKLKSAVEGALHDIVHTDAKERSETKQTHLKDVLLETADSGRANPMLHLYWRVQIT